MPAQAPPQTTTLESTDLPPSDASQSTVRPSDTNHPAMDRNSTVSFSQASMDFGDSTLTVDFSPMGSRGTGNAFFQSMSDFSATDSTLFKEGGTLAMDSQNFMPEFGTSSSELDFNASSSVANMPSVRGGIVAGEGDARNERLEMFLQTQNATDSQVLLPSGSQLSTVEEPQQKNEEERTSGKDDGERPATLTEDNAPDGEKWVLLLDTLFLQELSQSRIVFWSFFFFEVSARLHHASAT